MKYQVGDLVNYNRGNVDRIGYITKVNTKYVYITFFQQHISENIQEKMAYSYFELYYKVISKVKE